VDSDRRVTVGYVAGIIIVMTIITVLPFAMSSPASSRSVCVTVRVVKSLGTVGYCKLDNTSATDVVV